MYAGRDAEFGESQRGSLRVRDQNTCRFRESGGRGGQRGAPGFRGKRKDRKGTQEMGAEERSEKLRRRKSSLEEEGQRGSEKGLFVLSRGKGQNLSRPGPGGRRWERGARADRGGGAVPGVPGVPASLPEPLLSRCVPELQFDPFARLDLQQAGEEVHTDRGVAGGRAQPGKAALGEAVQEARLAYGGVPDHDEAELVDPDGLHLSRAKWAQEPPYPPAPSRRGASSAAGTVPSAPPGRPPAGFQHIPAVVAAAWSPALSAGEAGTGGRRRGLGLGAGRARCAGDGKTG